MLKGTHLPPELAGNRCHIAPEWESGAGQRLWFVSAPYGGSVLRFQGEPTSLLYAIAPLVEEIKQQRFADLDLSQVALLNPVIGSPSLYTELEQRLKRQDLRALCISTLTASSPEARRIAEIAKWINPRIVTIFGGPHEDDMAIKTAVEPEFASLVDFSVSGDGEYVLLELARLLFEQPDAGPQEIKELLMERAGRARFEQCAGQGALYFTHGGRGQRILRSHRTPLDLDALPRMPRELIHEADTRTFSVFRRGGRNVKTAQIMTRRGCHWRCSFCSESTAVNERSIESVKAEIDEVYFFRRHCAGRYERQDYTAIFFDDSTFTDRSPHRRAFLAELFEYLQDSGLEWGCQTRLDQVRKELLHDMKRAGCSYVFTGLESASEEMLTAMMKDEGRAEIEKAFDAAEEEEVRLGLSLIFGVAEMGSDRSPECERTILETLDFVQERTRQGNIALVSPNVATYYPGTAMTGALQDAGFWGPSAQPRRKGRVSNELSEELFPIAAQSGAQPRPQQPVIDFRNPLVNRGFPWNRFEEGESFHPRNVDRRMAEFIIRESVRRFGEYMVDQDIYGVDGYLAAYRQGELDRVFEVTEEGRHRQLKVVDLNHASISRPLPAAQQAAERQRRYPPSDGAALIADARVHAARLLGLPTEESDRVVFARNATEAASLVFWIAGLRDERQGKHVLTTNAENLSIPRAFRFLMDHGNPHGRDPWSSYQDYGAIEEKSYTILKRATRLEVEEVDILTNPTAAGAIITERLRPDTRLVVFSHVIRDTGVIVDASAICAQIRERCPNAYILIDGAQALGALSQVDVTQLGCDFYIAAPHKTLGTYPLGILCMSDGARTAARALRLRPLPESPVPCVVMEGMFAPELEVPTTVTERLSLAEIAGFSGAVEYLQIEGLIDGNNCTGLDMLRMELKEQFLAGLCQIPGVEIITAGSNTRTSHFILTFRLSGRDNRQIVSDLWTEHLVFASYIARTDGIRVSFGPKNDAKHIARALDALRMVCATAAAEPIESANLV